jgi:hypothetical protein
MSPGLTRCQRVRDVPRLRILSYLALNCPVFLAEPVAVSIVEIFNIERVTHRASHK